MSPFPPVYSFLSTMDYNLKTWILTQRSNKKREPGMGGVHGTNENVCENYFLSKSVKVEKRKGWSVGSQCN